LIEGVSLKKEKEVSKKKRVDVDIEVLKKFEEQKSRDNQTLYKEKEVESLWKMIYQGEELRSED